jgi:hypothetical protein
MWTLLTVMLLSGTGLNGAPPVATTIPGFTTQAACVDGGRNLEAEFRKVNNGEWARWVRVTSVCVEVH